MPCLALFFYAKSGVKKLLNFISVINWPHSAFEPSDVYAHLYLGLMLHTQEASKAIWILSVLLSKNVINNIYIQKRKRNHDKKYIFLHFFWLKAEKLKKKSDLSKEFFANFSMPLSEFQSVHCIRRYSTKTPENDKKSWKIQFFFHFFGLKTKKLKSVSDLFWRIFRELFHSVFRIQKCLLHPEIFNKKPR